MADRVIVTKPPERELPEKPVGKVHKRVVVEEGGNGKRPAGGIRAAFHEMLERNAGLLTDPKKRDAIGDIADLFVSEVKEEPGWHGQVLGIADSLEQNMGNEAMQELGRAIRYYAEQVWAARHVDDSKRSG